MPKIDELTGCLSADRANLVNKLKKIKTKKESTRRDLYRQLLRACRYIDGHLDQNINLATLAKLSGISRSHFIGRFEDVFDLTPRQYLIERRIAKARHLLKTTELTILEIVFEIGFASTGSFSNLFKKAEGLSPSQYRNKNRTFR